jgi:hypothetical protein
VTDAAPADLGTLQTNDLVDVQVEGGSLRARFCMWVPFSKKTQATVEMIATGETCTVFTNKLRRTGW